MSTIMMASWNSHFQSDIGSGSKVRTQRAQPSQPPINQRSSGRTFCTKSGITMFIPDVLFNPIPSFTADGEFGVGLAVAKSPVTTSTSTSPITRKS